MLKILFSIIIINYFIFNCFAYEAEIEGKHRLFEIKIKIEKMLDNDERCDENFLDENLRPLLKEVVTKGQIWENDKPIAGLPSFESFLCSHIGNHLNPFFRYAWTYYTGSERFRQENTEERQKTFNIILNMLDNNNYKYFHESLFWYLYMRCYNGNHFNEENIKLAQKVIMKHKNKYSIQLLLFLDKKDLNKLTLDYVISQADLAPNIANLTHRTGDSLEYVVMFIKYRIPFVSLIFLAKDGEQKYLKDLLSLLHNNGQFIDFELAKYLFPYLIFVKRKEVVCMLTEYLKDQMLIDQGIDVVHRYTGYWQIAAFSLYIMLDDFPQISVYNIKSKNRQETVDNERKKCLEWMDKHPQYNFKESIDWTRKDEITHYIKYMIFDR